MQPHLHRQNEKVNAETLTADISASLGAPDFKRV